MTQATLPATTTITNATSAPTRTVNNMANGDNTGELTNTLQQQQNNEYNSSGATSESSSSVISPSTMAEDSLHVEISDALSEKDKVKFTVHTRTTLPGFAKADNNVVRQHEEFVWLHDRFEENEAYAGYIVSKWNFFNIHLFNLMKMLYLDTAMSTKTRF